MPESFSKLRNESQTKQGRKRVSGRMKNFFKGVISELKKVHWPSRKQIINYTGIVLATCLAFALVISLFDWVVSSLLNLVLSI